jgi:AraC-like DNA-binding protein
MTFVLDARETTSPFVQEIWRARSECAGTFVSVAASHWELVVSRYMGATTLTVRGPETVATPLAYTAGGEWCGIRFKPGTFLSLFPAGALVDRAVTLPAAGDHTFWLHGAAWPLPEYDHADAFVDRLVRDGLLVRDQVVADAVAGRLPDISVRSVQRRFRQITGLTPGTVRQIERARHAHALLQRGAPILDVVYEAGYYDQAHMTRALKRWLGQTPGQISAGRPHDGPSLSYKT